MRSLRSRRGNCEHEPIEPRYTTIRDVTSNRRSDKRPRKCSGSRGDGPTLVLTKRAVS